MRCVHFFLNRDRHDNFTTHLLPFIGSSIQSILLVPNGRQGGGGMGVASGATLSYAPRSHADMSRAPGRMLYLLRCLQELRQSSLPKAKDSSPPPPAMPRSGLQGDTETVIPAFKCLELLCTWCLCGLAPTAHAGGRAPTERADALHRIAIKWRWEEFNQLTENAPKFFLRWSASLSSARGTPRRGPPG